MLASADVNFVGHAAAARWHSDEPGFALGAMLPDFATMCQAPVPEPRHPVIAAGVSHHHRADAAFHRLPGFLSLFRDAAARLRDAGATSGPARGAAHVAVELFLDGELVRDDAVADHYQAALALAAPANDSFALAGWDQLYPRLAARGVPHGYRDPEVVADIVVYILGRRPLLRPAPADEDAIRRQLPAVRDAVIDGAAGIMLNLRDRLSP